MRRMRIAGLVATALALALSSAAADPAAPTTIDALNVSVSDGTLDVDGQVTFGGDSETIVATDGTDDFADDPDLGPLAGPLGIDVTELAIHTPDARAHAVEFVIRVTDLQVPPPNEIIRFLWDFKVDGTTFRLQAKSSDIASTMLADDPVGALERLTGAFRLRGNCEVIGVLSNCAHLMWLDGVFDVENNEIRMTVPLNAGVSAFRRGAVISPESGDGDMTASIQVGASNNLTSDNVDVVGSYTIPRGTISFGIEPAGTDPEDVAFGIETGPTFIGIPGGDFSSSVDVSALAPGSYELFLLACFTDNCTIGSAPFDL